MFKQLGAIGRDNRGATAVEYGLICSLIVIAALAAIGTFAAKSNGMWTNVSTKVVAAGS